MKLIPMTVEEALEYAPKAALLDFDGPITPDFIAAMREHLSYAISALNVLADKLYEAEGTILDLHTSNLELADLLRARLPGVYRPIDGKTRPHSKLIKDRYPTRNIGFNGGIDPEYGTQMAFDDVPSREPIEIVTVEFRTDPGTYDANRGEIHRMLAEEIVATFGDKSAANPSEGGTETSELPPERGTQTDSTE